MAGTVLVTGGAGYIGSHACVALMEAGYEVVDFEDGLAAWNALSSGEHAVRLVVTDVEMPNMSGLELTSKIRESAAHKHLPVIALTASWIQNARVPWLP